MTEASVSAFEASTPAAEGASPLAALLRCLRCGAPLDLAGAPVDALRCSRCDARYPLRAGTVVMLDAPGGAPSEEAKVATARSFAYEWKQFGGVREEWERNFRDYLQPLSPEDLRGQLVLDLGTGSGRHSREAARHGARVVAVDLGAAIDVARRNLPPEAL